MSHDTDTLAREAETRRSNVESTIEELRSRMSVGQIVDELSGYMREGQAGAMAQNLGRQVRDNPLALGLVGAGLAWLLMGDGIRAGGQRFASGDGDEDGDDVAMRMGGRSGEGASGNHASSGLGGKVSGAASAASSRLSSASSRAGSAASAVGGSARRTGHDAADAVTRTTRAVMSGARSTGGGARRLGGTARRTLVDTLQEEPLIVGAVALAIGAAIGVSLPSTRIEDEYLGDTRDGLYDQAKAYGKDALETGKRVAERSFEAADSAAQERGLKPSASDETIAEKVAGVARAATQTARDEAHKEGLV